MAQSVPVHTKAGNLPMGATFAATDYQSLLLQRMKVYLSSQDVITGSKINSEPSWNIGPWWKNDSEWWAWSDTLSKYQPATLGFLNADKTAGISITAETLTANRTATFRPDISGDVAMTSDVYIPREAITLTGTAPELDVSTAFNFYWVLEGDSSFTIANMGAGHEVSLTVANAGTGYTLSFPSMLWTSGTPIQPSAAFAGQTACTIYTIRYLNVGIAKRLWAEAALDFSTGSAIVNTAPDFTVEHQTPIGPVDYNPYNIP